MTKSLPSIIFPVFLFAALGFASVNEGPPQSVPGLGNCSTLFGTAGLTACINENFGKVKKTLGIPLNQCWNPSIFTTSTNLTFQFATCVRENFETIGTKMQVSLGNCVNPGDAVSIAFTACVRENFAKIGK
jgi:hypothetical protein